MNHAMRKGTFVSFCFNPQWRMRSHSVKSVMWLNLIGLSNTYTAENFIYDANLKEKMPLIFHGVQYISMLMPSVLIVTLEILWALST